MSSDGTESSTAKAGLESVRYVGPATAAVLEREGYDAAAITEKRVSYRMLVDAGVNPGVAAKIRREHSLSWSFDSGSDLDRRSEQIRGLGSAEAEWIAASAGDWADGPTADDTPVDGDIETAAEPDSTDEVDDSWGTDVRPWPTHGESTATDTAADAAATTDGSGDAISAEAAWRARSKPTPVTDLEVVDETAATQLAEAGITSVRSLATADAEHVADVLGLLNEVVDEWYRAARDAHEYSE